MPDKARKWLKKGWQAENLAFIQGQKKEIEYRQKQYLAWMAEKKFELADTIKEIVDLNKIYLEQLKVKYESDYGHKIYSARVAADKTIFTIKK